MAGDSATSQNSAAGLTGTTTLDDKMMFEPGRLSYESADHIAQQIADEVQREIQGKTVVVLDTTVLNDLANLRAATVELEALVIEYKGLADNAGALQERRAAVAAVPQDAVRSFSMIAPVASASVAALSSLNAVVGAGLGLVSLFRQDVALHGTETKVDPLALEIAVGARLKAAGAEKVFLSDLIIPEPAKDKSLQKAIREVEEVKARAWQAIAPSVSALVQLDAKLDQAVTAKNQADVDTLTAEISGLRRDLQPVSDPLTRADQRLSDLNKQWNSIDDKSGLSVLARLLRAEAIHAMKAIYLHCAVVASGGHNRIVRSLWRTMFSGDGVSFMGGAVARWALLEKDGSLTKGGILVCRRGSADHGESGVPLDNFADPTAVTRSEPPEDKSTESRSRPPL
ncbi:MAG: hypothetical protein ABI165_00350 [Bryobacteraceae bacterium]